MSGLIDSLCTRVWVRGCSVSVPSATISAHQGGSVYLPISALQMRHIFQAYPKCSSDKKRHFWTESIGSQACMTTRLPLKSMWGRAETAPALITQYLDSGEGQESGSAADGARDTSRLNLCLWNRHKSQRAAAVSPSKQVSARYSSQVLGKHQFGRTDTRTIPQESGPLFLNLVLFSAKWHISLRVL